MNNRGKFKGFSEDLISAVDGDDGLEEFGEVMEMDFEDCDFGETDGASEEEIDVREIAAVEANDELTTCRGCGKEFNLTFVEKVEVRAGRAKLIGGRVVVVN